MARGEAPGRVNLMGDHTDYNGGLMLPVVLSRTTVVDVTPRDEPVVTARSTDIAPPVATYALGDEARTGGWIDYVQGTTWALREAGVVLRGFDVDVVSAVPVGAGLASSAALVVALLRALRATFDLALDDRAIASLALRAEVDFVGVPVGPMDPLAASLGTRVSALLIDAKTLDVTPVKLQRVDLVVAHSGVKHAHASGAYRERRRECEEAARALGVASLRELEARPDAALPSLPTPLDRRVRHVLTENERVRRTADVLKSGNLAEIAGLFAASHASLRDDFEVSVPEVDALVAAARAQPYAFGARLTGGGFGGAVVTLAYSGAGNDVGRALVQHARAHGAPGATLLTVASLG